MGKKRQTEIDKKGRGFILEKYNLVNRTVYVPDIQRFNTVQLELSFWIKTDEDTTNEGMIAEIYKMKRRIREYIRKLNIPFFQKESIVSIKTTNCDRRKVDVQSMNIDICYFVKPDTIFDRRGLGIIVENESIYIINELLKNNLFSIVRNYKIEARTRARYK